MDRQQVMDFLERHQPLSFDDHLNQSTLDHLSEVLTFMRANPEPAAVGLLVGLTGQGDAAGWFDFLAKMLLQTYPRDVVLPQIEKALVNHEAEGQAIWAAYFLWEIECDTAMGVLKRTLEQAPQSAKELLAEVLVKCAQPKDLEWVEGLLSRENDVDVKALYVEAREEAGKRDKQELSE